MLYFYKAAHSEAKGQGFKARFLVKRAIAAIALAGLSLLTGKAASAFSESPSGRDRYLSQQNCPDPQHYGRVITTSDPLSVRSTPKGEVIGSIPQGWAVVTNGKDSTGDWTHVTSHFGNVGDFGFASAPKFREGWVSTRFLRPLGRYCYKPIALLKLPGLLFSGSSMTVREDWTQRGDRFSRPLE
ncbi:MAG: SH3 domain-containing protein [Cyanobacteria bacterium SBLK]|nr:SH3 domain-containing protein [Cyanobacteria bacterium SBLK]